MTTSKQTAYQAALSIDRDSMAAKRTADNICHLLRDFIPEYCFRDAWNHLAEVAHKEGWELTNSAVRKEYETWKSLQIEGMLLAPAPS